MDEQHPERTALIQSSGEDFRRLRKELELTQGELAEILSFNRGKAVDIKTIYSWEKGGTKLPAWAKTQLEKLRNRYAAEGIAEQSRQAALEQKKMISMDIVNQILKRKKRSR